jgi:hypothetical protein
MISKLLLSIIIAATPMSGKIPDAVCSALAAGTTVDDLLDEIKTTSGLSDKLSTEIITESVETKCPQYLSMLKHVTL